jgi:acylphosphatase
MHFMIKGRVQGVWFRASAQDEAKSLSLTGFARNTTEGHVEVLACGEKEKVLQFYHWLQQGPELARVDDVESKEVPWEEFDRFYVK